MSYIIGLGFLLLLLAGLFFWIYKFVYNHVFIQEYSGKQLKRNKINEFINKLNDKYKLTLITINDNSYDDSNYDSRLIFIDQISRFKNKIIGTTFTITVTLSFQLIFLMMCELIDLFNEQLRLTLFHITINFLIFLIIFLQPFFIINLTINRDILPNFKNYFKLVATIILIGFWFYLLQQFGQLTNTFQPSYNNDTYNLSRSFIEKKINQISITGITLLALLSGIACISTPYKTFYDLYQSNNINYKKITESDLYNLIQSYNHTSSLLLKRKTELSDINQVAGTTYNQPSSLNKDNQQHIKSTKNKLEGIFHKVQSFASLSNISLGESSELIQLKQEIKSLKSLRNSLALDLSNKLIQYDQEKKKFENTSNPVKKLFHYGNILFAIYCIYRVFNVILIKMTFIVIKDESYHHNDAGKSNNQDDVIPKDALAITLSKLILSIFPDLPMSNEQLTSQLSFILTGVLFCCSFSNVLLTFNQFSKYLPTAKTSNLIKNWLKHLLISELVAIYVIATAILIRANLPTTLSQQISKILSLSGTTNTTPQTALLEIEYIDNWFDKVFAFTAVITLLLITVKHKIDAESGDNDYDEEKILESNYYGRF